MISSDCGPDDAAATIKGVCSDPPVRLQSAPRSIKNAMRVTLLSSDILASDVRMVPRSTWATLMSAPWLMRRGNSNSAKSQGTD